MSNLTVSKFLLTEIDPFASCAADAAILYLTDCADSSLSRSLVFQHLSYSRSHLRWHGPLSLQPSGKRTPSQKLMIEGCNSFVQFIPRRFMYAWAYGYENLPDGKDVEFSTRERIHSTCGVAECVNPEHLTKTHVYELGKLLYEQRSGAHSSGDVS
jgi:hypothetical protein